MIPIDDIFSEESSIPEVERQLSSIIAKATRSMRAPKLDIKKFEVNVLVSFSSLLRLTSLKGSLEY